MIGRMAKLLVAMALSFGFWAGVARVAIWLGISLAALVAGLLLIVCVAGVILHRDEARGWLAQ